jgi:hypothetical protein
MVIWFAFLALCRASVPVAPSWPTAFSVHFSSTLLNASIIGSPSLLQYDWSLKSQRITFEQGCVPNGTPSKCVQIYNATSAFLIQNGRCCAIDPGPAPTSPDWVTKLPYAGTTYAYGIKCDRYRSTGRSVHSYFIPRDSPTHPLVLLVEDIGEEWHFLEPFEIGKQDPHLFDIPSNCGVC